MVDGRVSWEDANRTPARPPPRPLLGDSDEDLKSYKDIGRRGLELTQEANADRRDLIRALNRIADALERKNEAPTP
jgi:hypothetical protein